jgi:hypothetical protein
VPERENVKKKRIDPVGPFAPPTPSEAEQDEQGEPMAVANDKQTIHGESFVPTTAPDGPKEPTPHGRDVRERHDQNRAEESPPDYTPPDEQGFAHLDVDRESEDAPAARVAASPPRDVETDEDEARSE